MNNSNINPDAVNNVNIVLVVAIFPEQPLEDFSLAITLTVQDDNSLPSK